MPESRYPLLSMMVSTCLILIGVSCTAGALSRPQAFDRSEFLAGFDAVDLSGKHWEEEAVRGKVVLIDFWATWCGPCLEEFPALKHLYEKYHPRGLEIIGVSLDTQGRVELERWLRRLRLPWPQFADFRGYSGELARRYAVTSIPTNFLVSRNGVLVAKNLRGDPLLKEIERLCNESSSR
jgi:thiol-disulfide isomerase/thioredoxin